MRIKTRVLQKIVSVLSSALLLVNSFTPYLLITPVFYSTPVGAQEEISPTQEPTSVPTQEVTPEVTVEPTVEPTTEPTVIPTTEVTPEVLPTTEVTSTEAVTIEPTSTPVVTTEVTPEVSPTVVEMPLQSVQESTPPSNQLEVTNSPSPPSPTPTTEVISTPNINGVVETTLVESYTCRADSLNGCLVTDKADYAPTDVAIISGHAFSPNTQYTLRVTSSDAPAVDSSYTITTDGNGSFTYSYQLDGTYRPNYLVELKDSFGFVVASVTFTDAVKFTVTIQGSGLGNGTVTGTSSINCGITAGVASGTCSKEFNSGTSISLTGIAASGSSFTGWSGGGCSGTGACNFTLTSNINVTAAFDLSGSGGGGAGGGNPSANLDQCANDPAPSANTDGCSASASDWVNGNVNESKAFYLEGDSIPYRMLFDNLSLASHAVTIEWDTTKASKHAIDYLTTFNRTVLTANPCLGVSGCGASTTIAIPSDPQVTGAGVTPVAGNFTLYGGTITGVSTYSYDDGAGFVGDKSARITITFTASQANPVLAWGGHIATRWDWGADNSAISISGSPYHTRLIDLDGSGGNQDRSLDAGAVIFPASITVIKQATPEGSTSFPFTASPSPLTNFSLVDDGTTANTRVFSGITTFTDNTGSPLYTVTENTPAGWTLDGIVCGVASANGGSQDVASPTVEIELKEGENVTCTFINSQVTGSINIVKDANPNDPQDFSFTGDLGSFSLDDDADGTLPSSQLFSGLVGGTYTVTEGSLSSWSLTNLVCNDADQGTTVDLTSRTATIDLDYGQNLTCTFTNTKKGHIIVDKVTDPTTSTQSFDFTTTGTGYDGFSLTNAATPDNQEVVPGSYTVAETAVDGWDLTSATCDKGETPASLDVEAGETVTCTFTNTKRGSISGYKYEDTDGSNSTTNDRSAVQGLIVQLWKWVTSSFTNTGLTDTTDSNGFYEFLDLIPGVYQVRELLSSLGSDWTNLSSTSTSDITVNPGDSKTQNNFVNTRFGNIIIVKDAVPNDAQDFTFTNNFGNSNPASFDLDDDADNTLSNSRNSEVLPGTYAVSEGAVTGWDQTSATCSDGSPISAIDVSSNETVTCTFVNSRKPTLKLQKTVVNDNGGNADESNFQAKISGVDANWDQIYTLSPGDYIASETTLSTYTPSDWGTDCSADGSVTLAYGDNKICTITNDDKAGSITITKNAVPNAGRDFNFTSSNPAIPSFTLDDDGNATYPNTRTFSGLSSGSYVITEAADSRWNLTNIVCVDPDSGTTRNIANRRANIDLDLGEDITCTFTNRRRPQLTVIKHVINDNGGSLSADDFTINVTGQSPSDSSFPGEEAGTLVILNPGTYGVDEVEISGYSKSLSADCSGTLAYGNQKTCTVTNDDIAPSLTLVKEVLLNHGGSAAASEWTLTATGPTTIFGAGGVVSGSTFATGDYVLSESTGPSGYTSGTWSCTNDVTVNSEDQITLGLGESTTCTIYNEDQPGTLIVKKHVINDNGGTKTAADFDLSVNGTEVAPDEFSGSEDGVAVTLNAGEYSVSEIKLDGYADSYSTDCSGTIGNGETKYCTVTNDDTYGKVIVTKFNDKNGDGIQDPGENNLSDWEITLSNFDNQFTNNKGVTEFSQVLPGEYQVGEAQQPSWVLTGISCTTEEPTPTPTVTETPTPTPPDCEGEECVTPSPTPTPIVTKMNICHYNASSHKWNAEQISENAWPTHQTHGDATAQDYLYGGPLASNGHPAPHTGEEWCRAHNPLLTMNFFGQVNAVDSDQISTTENIVVAEGQIVNCIIGNQQINPTLQISKSNDGFNRSQGDSVIYTLKIKALDSKVLGVKVKDLLPKGFSFQNVISIIRNGVDDITALVGDPAYHSPGTYNLGDMEQDDEIIIKYKAKIGDSQKFGIYKDVAWAEGTDVIDNKVLALAQPEGKVSDNFVGTSVKVDGTISEQGDVKIAEEGEVLGASTSLPATGANKVWIFIALLLSIIGAISVAVGLMFKKGKFSIMKNIFVNTLFTVVLFSAVNSVSAVSNMTIRLSEPKTPTKVNNFTVDFVTLDLTNSGLDITVKCFYKKNLADAWTQYGPDIIVAAPGNNGSCQEVSSFVTSTQTTYFFKATATNGAGSDDTELQGLVSVGYDDRDPSAPTNYVKEKISSCQYKISFKTADDGMTTRVEVYRSENTTMPLDGSTKAGEVAVGPNTSSSFTDTVPDCSKTYYYVIRAFNVQGNSSAAIGDSVTITSSTTSTTTTTTGEAIPVANVTLPAGGTGGSVLGEETTKDSSKEADKKAEVINVDAKKGLGTVLGTITKKENRNYLIIASILGLVIIAYGVYIYKKKRNSQQI